MAPVGSVSVSVLMPMDDSDTEENCEVFMDV